MLHKCLYYVDHRICVTCYIGFQLLFYLWNTCKLKLALIIADLCNNLGIWFTIINSHHALRNGIESIDLFIEGRLQFTRLEQFKQRIPNFRDTFRFILGICTPVETTVVEMSWMRIQKPSQINRYLHCRDVLQQQAVGRNLFNGTLSKTNDENTAIPGSAFCAKIQWHLICDLQSSIRL